MRIPQWLVRFVVVAFAAFAIPFAVHAAVDVNTADQSALESVKGIGPAMSSRIVSERGKGKFKDWSDLADRVSGLGDRNTAALSKNGLTVDGKSKPGGEVADAARPAKDTTAKKPSGDMAKK